MDKTIGFYLSDFEKNKEMLTPAIIIAAEDAAGFAFPRDYVEVIKSFNGSEGETGEHTWLILFRVEELAEINKDYCLLMEQIPDCCLFAKSSANTGYAYHKKILQFTLSD